MPKLLIVVGAALVLLGVLMFAAQRLGVGRLPGDFTWEGKNVRVHFPLASSIVLSLVLTLLLNWWLRRSR